MKLSRVITIVVLIIIGYYILAPYLRWRIG